MITLDRVPLRRGQQLLLGIDEGSVREWHPSRILSREAALVWVECPADQARALSSSRGAEVLMDTWRVMDARYTLRAEIISVETEPEPRLEVQLIEGTRIQHREYFRIPVFITPEQAGIEQGDGIRPVGIRLRDLSAVGARARCDEMLAIGDVLRLTIALPGMAWPLSLGARIVRVVEEPGPSDYPCEVGAAFIDLPSSVGDQIIRFALQVQTEELRRGTM